MLAPVSIASSSFQFQFPISVFIFNLNSKSQIQFHSQLSFPFPMPVPIPIPHSIVERSDITFLFGFIFSFLLCNSAFKFGSPLFTSFSIEFVSQFSVKTIQSRWVVNVGSKCTAFSPISHRRGTLGAKIARSGHVAQKKIVTPDAATRNKLAASWHVPTSRPMPLHNSGTT